MRFGSFLKENLRISFASIKSNRLRSILTISIIAIGMVALVGIVTATESIKSSVVQSFSSMGANIFTMSRARYTASSQTQNRRDARITMDQAVAFKRRYQVPATVSLSTQVSDGGIVKYGSTKTNPNVAIIGTDEEALEIEMSEIDAGRNFSNTEAEMGRNVAVIGADVRSTLFGSENPIGKTISIGGKTFQVVGTLKPKGSSMGGGNTDRRVLVPYKTAAALFAVTNPTYAIKTRPHDLANMQNAVTEAEGLLRNIRGLRITEPTDFRITQSDAILENLNENLSIIVLIGAVIGFITLLGASVGLMNIMLVSVNEKTREIGIRKSLGAKSSFIKQQFLLESTLISQIGGLTGIILGVVIGNLLSIAMGTSFVVPWNWVLIGFVLCSLVGIISGYVPAVKASRLDPIEALRYE